MKFKSAFLAILVAFNLSASEKTAPYCSLQVTEAWPTILEDTQRFLNDQLSSSTDARVLSESRFLDGIQEKGLTSEEMEGVKSWIKTMGEMAAEKKNPDLLRATVRATAKVLDLSGKKSTAEKIQKAISELTPAKRLELGLQLSDELDDLLKKSKDTELKKNISNWLETYPEAFAVFLTTNILRMATDHQALVNAVGATKTEKIVNGIKLAFASLLKFQDGVFRSGVGETKKSVSDKRFKRLLELGPKAEKRLRFITGTQVTLAVGSTLLMLKGGDQILLYNIFLQIFSPYLGSKMADWAYTGTQKSVNQARSNQKTWAMWLTTIGFQVVSAVVPDPGYILNYAFGPGSGGMLMGSWLKSRSLEVSPQFAADAIVDSPYFERLDVGQLTLLLERVSTGKKAVVEAKIKEVGSKTAK